ncbi:MAG: four helix bundle protein [Bacteroidales bacterium]|nr:four helix bundle protein [Bacteroidales bacterium]
MSFNKVKRFEDLIVWQKARILAKEVYILSKRKGISEDFGLKKQILNSSGSIPDNIAEGFERNGNKEYKQFLSIAKGSAGELRSQFYRIYDREILNEEEFNYFKNSVVEISKMLNSMMNIISSSNFKGTKYK